MKLILSSPGPRSRRRGTFTATGPIPVSTSRSGKVPWRTSRARPSPSFSSEKVAKSAAISASIACSMSLRAPALITSVSASAAKPDGSGSRVMVSSCMWHIPFSAEN